MELKNGKELTVSDRGKEEGRRAGTLRRAKLAKEEHLQQQTRRLKAWREEIVR